jgi:hypothetical protein
MAIHVWPVDYIVLIMDVTFSSHQVKATMLCHPHHGMPSVGKSTNHIGGFLHRLNDGCEVIIPSKQPYIILSLEEILVTLVITEVTIKIISLDLIQCNFCNPFTRGDTIVVILSCHPQK